MLITFCVAVLLWWSNALPYANDYPLWVNTISRLIVLLLLGRIIADIVAPWLQAILRRTMTAGETVERVELLQVWGDDGLILRDRTTGRITYRTADGGVANMASDKHRTVRVIEADDCVLLRRTPIMNAAGRVADALIRTRGRSDSHVVAEFHVPAARIVDHVETAGVTVGEAGSLMSRTEFQDRIRNAGTAAMKAET